MTEHYEAVVVGAGPAGLSTALELARNDVETLVLERGRFPGSKNSTGGVLYGQANTPYNLDDVLPDLHEEAPLERPIRDVRFHCLAGDKVKSFDLTGLHEAEHAWSYAVLRAKFDRWLGERVHERARETGGGLLSDVRVTGPLFEDGEIVGVETAELEPITADLVVAADGATSEMVRKAGLRGWEHPDEWFQGVKVVVDVPGDQIEDAFDLDGADDGAAHLFAGTVFEGVRGSGFLYTNEDTLSIGTVLQLDALTEGGVEPHRLMDRLIEHPLLQQWLTEDAEEAEYSAKLVPDGREMAVEQPYKDRMLAVGDAAGQVQTQGPIVKGMNLGVTAGITAARAFVEARDEGNARRAGPKYTQALADTYVPEAVRPSRYETVARTGGTDLGNGTLESLARSWLGRAVLGSGWGQRRVERMLNDPTWAGVAPDVRFSYATLPEVLAEEAGEPVDGPTQGVVFEPRSLEDRIEDLDYDTDVGNPHIRLLSRDPEHSGAAVHTCPVSDRESTDGCFRYETEKRNGDETRFVALDTQPCVECGTCAIVAATEWEHPDGGRGVQYEHG